MLESLHVKNLALIDEAEVDFSDGLNILTGETGAGKSILIGSVQLALGAKAEKEYIRTGAEYALVELVFSLSEEQEKRIREMDLLVEEDHTLLLQRKMTTTRSISKIGGEAVSSGQLKMVASILLDLCSQHENQILLKPAKQAGLLDGYAGKELSQEKEKLKESFQNYQKLVQEFQSSNLEEAERQREADLLHFELEEMEEAALKVGEDEELEKQYRKMNNSKRIQDTIVACHLLTGYEEEDSAGEILTRALREMKGISGYDEEADELTGQLTEIDDLLGDFNRSLSHYQESLSFDEQTYQETQERLNLLNHLKNKYHTSIEGILSLYEEKEQRLLKLSDYEAYLSGLEEKIHKEKEQLMKYCMTVSGMRRQAADKLEKQLIAALQDLNFAHVDFEIAMESSEDFLSENGYDKIVYMISTNPGEAKKPLAQVASGGELSRIMLAFKTVFADEDGIGTLVFDEIDTGISGKTAWKVSGQLKKLSQNHQVICITHLPQIAAQAKSHFVIEKQVRNERAVTEIKALSEKESMEELARLLGGDSLTEAAIQNAKEMKELALKSRNEME